MKSPHKISCLIPFFNEGERLFSVLKFVTKIPEISQVICIDDGSSDNISSEIEDRWPTVDLICLQKNEGKSSAIRHGLQAAKYDYVLLMDADLQFLNFCEIENAIQTVYDQNFIDMLILRRIKAPWYFKIDRRDVLFSGERILRKNDLEDILKDEVWGYQLEIAINRYMIRNQKVVRWIPWSASNTHKAKKWGFFYGFKKEILMFQDMIVYGGVMQYLLQILIFARKRIE